MSSHHSRSPTSTKIDRLSEATLSGGQQTYESFGSRTASVKTLSVSTSKPPSPTLIGETNSVSGYHQAVTGNSATNSTHSSSANIASDLVRLAASGSVSGSVRASSLRSSKSASSLAVSAQQSRRSSNASSKRSSPNKAFLSTVEEALLRSDEPIEINETAEVEVFGNRGVWVNREEALAWRGVIPLEDYPVNEDDEPEVITKRSAHQIEYVQELAIRYLRPPTPPAPGEIVITQEPDVVTGPAPPLIIRQQPPRPETPEPLVIREAPPEPPMPVGVKKITISGKQLPPPPRKVIIERLAPLPAKPQNVIIERWLPYSQVKRRVIFNKPAATDPVIIKPRNIIVQWEAPQVQIKKEYKYLGVITANPVEYVAQYGPTLKQAADLPEFVHDIKAPEGLTLAADVQASNFPELEGDVHALKLVDLEKEGLGEYSDLVRNIPSRVSRSASHSTIRPSVGSIASSAVSQATAVPRPSSKATSVASSNFTSINQSRLQSSAVVSTSASSAVVGQSRTTSIASKAPSAGSVSVVSRSPSAAKTSASVATSATPRQSVEQSVAAASSSASVRQSSASVAATPAPASSNSVSFSVSATLPGSASQSQASSSFARQSTASTAVVSNSPSFVQRQSSAAISSGSVSVAPVASRTTSISKSVASVANSVPVGSRTTSVAQSSASVAQSTTSSNKRKNSISSLIEQIFHTINRNNSGGISIEDAEKALLRLNSRLGRRYGEDDVIAFFSALDKNQDGTLDFDEFKSAFENIVI